MKGEGWEVGGKAGDDGRVEPSRKKKTKHFFKYTDPLA